jgi:lipopolysaccharide/colanic/teichoic acid biosynthesis glycosyltransferase
MKFDYSFFKRCFDIIFSFLILIFGLPLLIIISLLIKFDSKGSVIYRGLRTGVNGSEFYMYKFRTMHDGSELQGTTTALNDPRITRIGKYLRKYKLDELPQFFNVLVADMSIVGPRPEVSEHTSIYTGDELRILSVKPGITDYSSIYFSSLSELLGEDNAHFNFVSNFRHRKNLLRIRYVDERSFLVDLYIILNTVKVILLKFQAK